MKHFEGYLGRRGITGYIVLKGATEKFTSCGGTNSSAEKMMGQKVGLVGLVGDGMVTERYIYRLAANVVMMAMHAINWWTGENGKFPVGAAVGVLVSVEMLAKNVWAGGGGAGGADAAAE